MTEVEQVIQVVQKDDLSRARKEVLEKIEQIEFPPERISWLITLNELYFHLGTIYAFKLLFEGRVGWASIITGEFVFGKNVPDFYSMVCYCGCSNYWWLCCRVRNHHRCPQTLGPPEFQGESGTEICPSRLPIPGSSGAIASLGHLAPCAPQVQ